MNNDPTIMITGTRTGIGLHLAEYYLANGHVVIGCSRNKATIQHDNYHHFILDISDEKLVKNMFSDVRKKFGHLDCLLNNAGIASMKHAILTPLNEVNDVFTTNFAGTFLTCREAVKLMKRNNFGRIINFSSIHTKLGIEGTSIYGASKAAVENFTFILAREIFQYGITANILSLSIVQDTGMADLLSEQAKEKILSGSVSKTIVKLDDVVNTINFLLAPQNRLITGQNIGIG